MKGICMSIISIVMATYNGETYLREQIESIIANTYFDWDIEICDDGSKDNTKAIAKEYELKYPEKIHFYENKKNLGVALNFLEGAKRAKGSYVMFCDQDDVWLPFKIERTLKLMKKMEKSYGKEKPLTVFTDAIVVDTNLKEISASFYKTGKLNVKKLDLPHVLMENKLLGCTVMFNRYVLEYLHTLPRVARYHDWWIAILTTCFGEIGYLKEGTLLYRQHEKNVVGNQSFSSYAWNRLASLKKQKKILVDTKNQGFDFYKIYQKQLQVQQKKILIEFSTLDKMNWIMKRYKIIKYGFVKTGLVRNIGLLFII
jgi:glycosyltransferase involved in cell wall biosynthesis